jgi:hypothetical protein
LFEPVRLFGVGRWVRDRNGIWNLDNFLIDRFEALSDEPLSSVLVSIGAIERGEWSSGSLEELRALRAAD